MYACGNSEDTKVGMFGGKLSEWESVAMLSN